jgi:prepilin-type N-terminal cleavage/methylation domain-containing protein
MVRSWDEGAGTGSVDTMRYIESRRPARGFTLIELMIVVVIIGIMLGLILTAAMGGVRRAEERATQSLIAKLESGLTDRIDALMTARAQATIAHLQLASLYGTGTTTLAVNPSQAGGDPLAGSVRAQVIAQTDLFRAEVPDVFYVPAGTSDIDYNASYPINFGFHQFAGASTISVTVNGTAFSPPPAALPMGAPIDTALGLTVGYVGMNGASFTAAAGLYKNAGYRPVGYDGVDNDGNGLIDDLNDGKGDPKNSSVLSLSTAMANHKHSTARAEMLYAMLVEGQGPYGSVFNADEFTTKEVQDTDGDGLPEFVDAWGQPLQFFRWPTYYKTDIQKGLDGYSVFESRQQDSLDPNQQLVAPAWWAATPSATNGGPAWGTVTGPTPTGASTAVRWFQYYFHSLSDPISGTRASFPSPNGTAETNYAWDRGSYPARRAHYTKFLILSGGPDKTPGVFLYPDTATLNVNALMIEGQAWPNTWDPTGAIPTLLTGSALIDAQDAATDDITNHNLQAAGGITQ